MANSQSRFDRLQMLVSSAVLCTKNRTPWSQHQGVPSFLVHTRRRRIVPAEHPNRLSVLREAIFFLKGRVVLDFPNHAFEPSPRRAAMRLNSEVHHALA